MVAFAAMFSGAPGGEGERFSVFTAPPAVFDAMSGADVLVANPPSQGVRPAAKPVAKTVGKTASVARTPAQTPPASSTSGMSADAARLLSSVRGDIDRVGEQTAVRLAREADARAAAQAAQTTAERERIYAASGARKGTYPAPSEQGDYLVWPEQGSWQVQVPRDPTSPRFASRSSGARPEAALEQIARELGMDVRGATRFEKLDAYAALDGRDMQVLLTETRMDGKPAVAFVLYGLSRGSDAASLYILEAPARTYEAWGGVAAMLKMRRVVPSVDVFPAAQRRRIARAALTDQMAFYEVVPDRFYEANSLAMMMTQAQTTAMMMELNYDLLFGHDITPGP